MTRLETSAVGLDVRRWPGALGADVLGLDVRKDLDSDVMASVVNAFSRYQVLAFRDQDLTPDDQLTFALHFGEIDRYPFAQPLRDHPGVVAITKEPGTELNFGGVWHADSPYMRVPPRATVLYGVDIPSRGGDTMFADTYRAYEMLSDGMKRMLDGLRGVFCACDVHGQGAENLKLGDVVRVRDMTLAETENAHPIVRTHPVTGRKALYISRVHVQRFANMTQRESAPLLDFLAAHACDPIFTARLTWDEGTLVVFDNRCVQHLALNDYPTERREIHRIVICDDEAPS
jgi:taurine dioxygenase